MNKTKIDWADMTWNPVTGCLNECEYCYARKIAERFGLEYAPKLGDPGMEGAAKYDTEQEGMDTMLELQRPYVDRDGRRKSYPMAFYPTFHRYKLNEPLKKKESKTIFVCSMADLFGDWVPDEWIKEIFEACEKAPQHRYIFLTKNPKRYVYLCEKGMLPRKNDFWFGSTITQREEPAWIEGGSDYGIGNDCYCHKKFISIEPILKDFTIKGTISLCRVMELFGWVIIGAETGNRKNKVIPERKWIENIANACKEAGTPVFMKNNLSSIWHDKLIQELPWAAI